jgi:hypothetical protein
MSHCQKVMLDDRAVIAVAGADAQKFLQGQISNDIGKASDGSGLYAALLMPQGKILFDFFITRAGETYLLDCRKDQAEALIKRLSMYRLRAAVSLEPRPELMVAALLGLCPSLDADLAAYPDPRLDALGIRVISSQAAFDALPCEPAERPAYEALRIRLGVPQGGQDFAYADAFPHEALLDQLDGVDFKKGCYVGQEVVSRMEHRGTARKRIVPVLAETDLPPSGTPIEADGFAIGTLGSVAGTRGLALIRLDRAGDAIQAGQAITAGGIPIRLEQPGFARFQVPVPA